MATQTRAKKDGKATGTKVITSVEKGRQMVKAKGAATKPTNKAKLNGIPHFPSRALSDFANSDIISVVAQSNPRSAGTKDAARFKLFQTGQTVAECLATQKAKGFKKRRAAIRKAMKRGDIKIEKAKARKTTEAK